MCTDYDRYIIVKFNCKNDIEFTSEYEFERWIDDDEYNEQF